jgi:hypothetical protein
MKSFLEEDERKALESLKTHPDDAWQRAAQVILLADRMPIRRTAKGYLEAAFIAGVSGA